MLAAVIVQAHCLLVAPVPNGPTCSNDTTDQVMIRQAHSILHRKLPLLQEPGAAGMGRSLQEHQVTVRSAPAPAAVAAIACRGNSGVTPSQHTVNMQLSSHIRDMDQA